MPCIGAITNVAAALKAHPEISSNMKIVWIAGHDYARGEKVNFREYNSGNDIIAGNIIFNNDVELWQIPKIRVYTSIDSRFVLEDFISKLELLY